MERVTGIGPVTQPWEGRIIPLNHTRDFLHYNLIKITSLKLLIYLRRLLLLTNSMLESQVRFRDE